MIVTRSIHDTLVDRCLDAKSARPSGFSIKQISKRKNHMSMPNNSIFCLRFFFLPGSMASSCDRHHTRQSSHLFLCVLNKEKGDTLPGVAERACRTEACWSGAEACWSGDAGCAVVRWRASWKQRRRRGRSYGELAGREQRLRQRWDG